MNAYARAVGAAFAILIAGAHSAAAQDYPSKPLRILVGFAAGGGIDISARALAAPLGTALGQQVIVDNRPGAGSNIAAAIAAKSAPDGYTLFLGSIAALAINPSLYGNLPFDPVRDFAPVSQTGTMSNIIVVHPVVPAKSLAELVALAKREPGEISYATPGAGSSAHLAGELLKRSARINMVAIPYKGGGQAIVDTLAGHVPVFFASVPVVVRHVASGKLRALAVTTAKRAGAMPGVPTVVEAGYPGIQVDNWYGLVAPAGTPRAVIEKLNREVAAVLSSPPVVKRIRELGHDAATSSPAQFGAQIAAESARWGGIIKDLGIRAR